MWIENIVLQNHVVGCVENEIEISRVNYPKVKITKIVLDTSQYLVEIIKENIAKMLKAAPVCQIIFDELTNSDIHYVGLYVVKNAVFPVFLHVGLNVVLHGCPQCGGLIDCDWVAFTLSILF